MRYVCKYLKFITVCVEYPVLFTLCISKVKFFTIFVFFSFVASIIYYSFIRIYYFNFFNRQFFSFCLINERWLKWIWYARSRNDYVKSYVFDLLKLQNEKCEHDSLLMSIIINNHFQWDYSMMTTHHTTNVCNAAKSSSNLRIDVSDVKEYPVETFNEINGKPQLQLSIYCSFLLHYYHFTYD